jgi:lipopolysaccharide transport system permease protein
MKYLKEVWASRELLVNLTRREIKGKYKRTVFGQLWSLVNPLALMLIYTLVFALILRVEPDPGSPSGLNVFALWLLCGLLPWTFLSVVINVGLGSLVANANLIQKVYFSRIVLPLSIVGSSVYNWLFEMAVLLIALSIAGGFVLPWIPLLLVVMVLITLFAAGIALMLSVLNVYFRDTQYFITLLLQIWMYLSPIIYPQTIVQKDSATIGGLAGTSITLADLYGLNPMEHFVAVFRQLLYDERWPDGSDLLICAGWAIASFVIGVWVFRRNERKLAEIL